jgi:hypothetical protein
MGGDRHVPEPRGRKAVAFYGIFLGHQHRQIIPEFKVGCDQRLMVGKGVLDDLEPNPAQHAKESCRVANAGNGMHERSAKLLQRTALATAKRHGLCWHEPHLNPQRSLRARAAQ